MAGRNVQRNFPGDIRPCTGCAQNITVTDQMCKQAKYRCSPCQVLDAKRYVERNREKKRLWVKEYSARMSPERKQGALNKYRDKYPERAAARNAVQTAIRNGSLVRGPCEVCGEPNGHGHHDDYSRPLDVRWLCHTHHMEHHHAE